MRCLLLLLLLLAGPAARAAQVVPVEAARFVALDSDEVLAAQLGEDRLLKYLIRTAPAGDLDVQLNRVFLERVVGETLADGSAEEEMGASLAAGDEELQLALARTLKTFNFNDTQIASLLDAWAAGKPPEAIHVLLLNVQDRSNSVAFLVDYLMDTKNSWPRVCVNVSRVLQGTEPLTPEMMRESLVNNSLITDAEAESVLNAAVAGDAVAKLDLLSRIDALLASRGTVARYLQTAGSAPSSWYEATWRRAETLVAGDPLYLSEYVTRLNKASFLYDQWRLVAIQALQHDDKGLFKGYFLAAGIPGSRFEWTVNLLTPASGAEQIVGADQSVRIDHFAQGLLAKMKADPDWTDYLLWQLTRPAEAFTLTLRQSLPTVLGASVPTSRALVEGLAGLPGEFDRALSESGAFDFYGAAETFRVKASEGQLDDDALRKFGLNAGRVLAYSDKAWASFLNPDALARPAQQAVVEEAINSDPKTVIALIRTLQANDRRLSDRFAVWMIQAGNARTRQAYDLWLDQVVAELAQGRIAGNPDVANFKAWFIEFVQTFEGWQAFLGRLDVESATVNERLRASMEAYLMRQEAPMWPILRATSAVRGPMTETLLPRLQGYVIRSHLNELLLREISQQNQAATDALYPVWSELLAPGSPTLNSLVGTIQTGGVLSDLYSVYADSFAEVLSQPVVQKALEPDLRAAVNARPEEPLAHVVDLNIEQLRNSAAKSQHLIVAATSNPQVFEAWRMNFLNKVRISGKGYVVADHILRNGDLQKAWADLVARALSQDPGLLERVIYSLSYRKVGDVAWLEQIDASKLEVINILLEDRVMFEQLLANQDAYFTASFREAVARRLGPATASAWSSRQPTKRGQTQ